jgi:peptidoglycan/LPS O-acetylase OafA/YrhL
LFLATGPERTPGVFWPPSQSIGIFLVLLVAPLSYHFFEKPFINLKNKFAKT